MGSGLKVVRRDDGGGYTGRIARALERIAAAMERAAPGSVSADVLRTMVAGVRAPVTDLAAPACGEPGPGASSIYGRCTKARDHAGPHRSEIAEWSVAEPRAGMCGAEGANVVCVLAPGHRGWHRGPHMGAGNDVGWPREGVCAARNDAGDECDRMNGHDGPHKMIDTNGAVTLAEWGGGAPDA